MKKLVQNSGVRKWYGDEWITIQDEANAAIEGYFGSFGQQYILAGCEVSGADVDEGMVVLNHADGIKVCRLSSATGLAFPCFLKVTKTEETRLYLDGAVKPIAYTYVAEISATNDGGYLELKADNTTPRFADALQDASHRMLTDAEKSNYAGQASSAIATLRDNVATAYNTLAKLKNDYQTQINNLPASVSVEVIYATIRGGVAETLDTLQKVINYVDGLTYFPTFMGTSEQATAVIDWQGTPERTMVVAAPTQFDGSNLIVGKTIGLKVSGAYAITFAAKFKKILGSPDPSLTLVNYIQMKCISATEIIYSVIYIS